MAKLKNNKNNDNRKPTKLSELDMPSVETRKGLFTAWERNVPDKKDPTKTVKRFKCVCVAPKKDNPDVFVDVAAWISESCAAHFGITNGDSFVGVFAYSHEETTSPAGQYNEEVTLFSARLLKVVD